MGSGFLVEKLVTELSEVVVSTIAIGPLTAAMDLTMETMGTLLGEERFGGSAIGWKYETLVFPKKAWEGKEALLEIDARRYMTEEEARKGHAELVRKWWKSKGGSFIGDDR